jgi:hypothetical protein
VSRLLTELGLKIAPDRKDKAFIRGAGKSDIAYMKGQFGSKGARLNELTGGFPLTEAQGGVLDQALEENLKTRTSKWLKNRDNYEPLARTIVDKIVTPEKDRLEQLAAPVSNDPCMTQVPQNANPQEILASGLAAARQAVTNALKTRATRVEQDINNGRALLPPVRESVTKAEAAAKKRLEKEAYEREYAKIKTDYDKAVQVWSKGVQNVTAVAVASQEFLGPWNTWNKAVLAVDWIAAKAAVPPLGVASKALNKVATSVLAAKPGFDIEEKKIVKLEIAKNIANAPPKALVGAEVKEFREKYATFNDAKNNGDFTAATSAIAPLKTAIANLIEANDKIEEKKQKFKDEKDKIADYEKAKALAKANSPAVAAKIAAFNAADGNVDTQVKNEDWTEAAKLIPALKTATEKLLEARNTSNSSLTQEDKNKFAQKMKALEPRTALANTPGPAQYVTALKNGVKGLVGKITSSTSAGDYASAELLHAQLLPELDKMDTAIREFNAFASKFAQAKNGEIKTVRATAMAPPKLSQDRDKALQATEDRIAKTADKGSAQKATDLIPSWIEEAKAWKDAKAAFDNLNTGADVNPQVLRDLANKPGGGKVLDALVDGLPEGRPEKFLKEAMNVRYGVNVKRFQSKTANYWQDESGMTVVGPNVPDKDLKKMYQMFGKVPIGNIKGKVTELIQFDADEGGAAALGGKIWMYAGRPDKGNKQQFKGAVPDGEEVEADFQPANDDAIPYFDFAALHEVGHIIDEKQGVMTTQGKDAIAGWKTHPSTDDVAKIAAAHFKYDENFVKATLRDPKSTPPTTIPGPAGGASQQEWDKRREDVVTWCKSIRENMSLWYNANLAKHTAIGGRVYQEAYVGQPFVSYDLAARNKGISPYQFRSAKEWFAELYAAYFSGKLKKNHPYASWLQPLKKI